MTQILPQAQAAPLVETFDVRSKAGDRDYRIQVGLPLSYGQSDRSYPVVYVLDAAVHFYGAVAMARLESMTGLLLPDAPVRGAAKRHFPETIVVGVGFPATDPLHELQDWAVRRNFEYSHASAPMVRSVGATERVAAIKEKLGTLQFGGAEQFLAFLADELRPAIDKHYRTTAENALFGHSAAGNFGAYALLSRPGVFDHYVLGSPGLYLSGEAMFELEAAYAAEHADLDATVFLGFGSREVEDLWLIPSATTRFDEALRGRRYPGLRLDSWVFTGDTHISVAMPALARGLAAALTG